MPYLDIYGHISILINHIKQAFSSTLFLNYLLTELSEKRALCNSVQCFIKLKYVEVISGS